MPTDDIRLEPVGSDANARIELPVTPEPARAVNLVLHRMTQADALKALASRADRLARQGQFSGAVLVAKDGRVRFRRAYGLADRERRIPNTVRTRFRIGSMNKMFTAVAILQLGPRTTTHCPIAEPPPVAATRQSVTSDALRTHC